MNVIVYDDQLGRRVSTFLALVKLEQCNAESIATAVKETLQTFKLLQNNLVGIGTDNASVMTTRPLILI